MKHCTVVWGFTRVTPNWYIGRMTNGQKRFVFFARSFHELVIKMRDVELNDLIDKGV